MALSPTCAQLSTSLARQTPVYQENFLKDFVSDMTTAPFLGRHKTDVWADGAQTIQFDKIHVGQPNYTQPWNIRQGADCNISCPTTTYVSFGTTRDQFYTENL